MNVIEPYLQYSLPLEDLIGGLSKFYDDQSLCDTEIQVEGKVFKVHRLVLAAYSPYFEASYIGSFREAKGGPLILQQGVTSNGLAVVLRGLYTTHVRLSKSNVVDTLITAHFLQIKHIVTFCENFMMQNMDQERCLQYLKLAEVYNLDYKIIHAAEKCFVENFLTVSQDEDFLDMSKDALCKYLDSRDIRCKEIDILKAAVHWLNQVDGRMQFAAEILGCVRLALFKVPDLISEVLRLEFVKNSPDCQKLIDEAISYSSDQYSKPLYSGSLNQARASETMILLEEVTRLPGRYETEDTETKIYFCKYLCGKWDWYDDTVDVPFAFSSATAVTCNNFMFVHGVDGRYCGNVMRRFDGSTRTWIPLTPIPQQATVGYVAACVNSWIILTGGLLIDRNSATNVALQNIVTRTFKYNIGKNEWSEVENLPHKVAFGAGCTISSQNTVLVTGGYTDVSGQIRKTNKVVTYDLDRNIWLTRPPLRNARVQHSCAEYEGKIYVVGGGGNPEVDVTDTCEIFCPETMQWSTIRAGHSIKGAWQIVFRNQLLAISGRKPVMKFVTEKNKWKRTDISPPCKASVVAVLKVPRPRHDDT